MLHGGLWLSGLADNSKIPPTGGPIPLTGRLTPLTGRLTPLTGRLIPLAAGMGEGLRPSLRRGRG